MPLAEERSIDAAYEQARGACEPRRAARGVGDGVLWRRARRPRRDLTLYAMLERRVGDSMQPGVHGPRSPPSSTAFPRRRACSTRSRRRTRSISPATSGRTRS